MRRNMKCDKCKKGYRQLYIWFGFSCCNKCIVETVKEMKDKGVMREDY